MRPSPRATAPKAHFHGKRLAARIAKRGREFNGGGHLARQTGLCVNPAPGTAHSPQQHLPAVLCHLDRRAIATTGKDAILVLAHRGHCVRQPKAGSDQSEHKNECDDIHDHAVAIVVWILAARIFCQVIDRWRRGCTRIDDRLSATKADDPRSVVGMRWFSIRHVCSLPQRRISFDRTTRH